MSKVEKIKKSVLKHEKRHHKGYAGLSKEKKRQRLIDFEVHGEVYTPVEVVDFMVKSISEILQNEFDTHLGGKDVHIEDPFTGTGNFITAIIRSDQISDEDLRRKYNDGSIEASEINPRSAELAKANIEAHYEDRIGESESFDHLQIRDYFQAHEDEEDQK